jgi:hypothetical protein
MAKVHPALNKYIPRIRKARNTHDVCKKKYLSLPVGCASRAKSVIKEIIMISGIDIQHP